MLQLVDPVTRLRLDIFRDLVGSLERTEPIELGAHVVSALALEDILEHKLLRRCEDAWRQRTAFPWSLWLKSDGSFAGVLEARVKQHSVDIGYVLAPRLWRRGLMSEAVGGLVQWAMSHPEVYRIWAVCDVDNVASARLLESVGMHLEGTLRRWLIHPNMSEQPRDCLCYAAVKGY